MHVCIWEEVSDQCGHECEYTTAQMYGYAYAQVIYICTQSYTVVICRVFVCVCVCVCAHIHDVMWGGVCGNVVNRERWGGSSRQCVEGEV